jgi:SAM-dependent methyltransferase
MPSWGTLPPSQQMQRVGLSNGNLTAALVLGASFHKKIKQLMQRYANKSLYDCDQIMDWGCGYGRLVRFFPPEHRHKVTAADIDPINITWAKENMPDIDFQVVPTQTPTQFLDGQFDLVYGNSVFTHLAEQDQFAWLAELRRITKIGGIVAVTVHGHVAWSFLGWHNSEGIVPLLTKGFRESGIANPDLVDVVGDFYTDVHHTHSYILQHWTRFFDVLDILEGFSGRQAMVVLRRRAD